MSPDIESVRGECEDSPPDWAALALRTHTPRAQAKPQLPKTMSALQQALLSSRALVGIEDLPPTSHLQQQLRRLEPAGKALVQILEPLHHDLNAE